MWVAKSTTATNAIFGETDNSESNVTMRVVIDAASKVFFDPQGDAGTENLFVKNAAGYKSFTLTDQGAAWEYTAKALKQGVILPELGEDAFAIALNNKLYNPKVAGKIVDADAADTAALEVIRLEDLDFAMENGAAVRTKDPAGIRFITSVSSEAIELLQRCGSTITYGTYIAPTALVKKHCADGKFDPNLMLAIDKTSVVKVECGYFAKENTDGKNQFYACLYGMNSKEAYEMELSAISYLTVTFANDANGVTIYTTYSEENNSRSILQVAQAAVAAGHTDAYLQKIIDACN